MNVLAICGSIRNTSSNFSLLAVTQSFFPKQTTWDYFHINKLPFFDPQLQFDPALPESVQSFRSLASGADFIVISTPEYAHGIPGILKNALEWLVCEETMKKKVVMIIGTPSGGAFVREYLAETIRTMDLLPSDDRTLVVTSARSDFTPDGNIINKALETTIKNFVRGFLE